MQGRILGMVETLLSGGWSARSGGAFLLARAKAVEHLAPDKGAATRKQCVPWPSQARWVAFWLWGDKRGDARLLGSLHRDRTAIGQPAMPKNNGFDIPDTLIHLRR